MKKPKQIRFARPNPQVYLNDIFLQGKPTKQSMMVVVDPHFKGQPDHVRPDKEVPLLYKEGKLSLKIAVDIFTSVMELLKKYRWKFKVPSVLSMGPYLKIMKKCTHKDIKITKYKHEAKNTRNLLVFASDKYIDRLSTQFINAYLERSKPICVVNEYGVKRYPRKDWTIDQPDEV